MHVLITGIAGFVGSRLARLLLGQGDRVSGTYLDVGPRCSKEVDLYEADVHGRAPPWSGPCGRPIRTPS